MIESNSRDRDFGKVVSISRPRLGKESFIARDRDSYSRIVETETRKMCIFETEIETETRKMVETETETESLADLWIECKKNYPIECNTNIQMTNSINGTMLKK